MSSRAFKKLYGKDDLGALAPRSDHESESEEEAPPPKNPFLLLGDDDEDEEDEDETAEETRNAENENGGIKEATNAAGSETKSAKKRNKKKKKKAKKSGSTEPEEGSKPPVADSGDDIDALLDGMARANVSRADETTSQDAFTDIDPKHLDFERELGRLFGKEAMSDADSVASSSLFPPMTQHSALWGGRDGRTVPGTSRRLVFAKIKPTFPPAFRREITMEASVPSDGHSVFKFVHSEAYQQCERTYLALRSAGDPQVIVNTIFQKSYYHVLTLLMLADNFSQSGQHSEAADMIERCLVTYDRVIKPGFVLGKSKLPFKYYENRGFYLTLFKHIRVLMRRGTWRTALEVVKLLWSLDLDGSDPYGAGMLVDFFAINAGEYKYLLSISDTIVAKLPNIAYSQALAAFVKNDENRAQIEERLVKAIKLCPAIAHELLGTGDPTTRSPRESIVARMYGVQMKSLWNPQASLLDLMQKQLELLDIDQAATTYHSVPLDDGLVRYVLLSEQKEALEFVPSEYLSRSVWSDDILPPLDDVTPY